MPPQSKEHPYRHISQSLRLSALRDHTRVHVLGLTASLTYAVGEKKVVAAINQLCQELGIVKMETATEAELHASGYHGGASTTAEVKTLDLPSTLPLGVLQKSLREPHLMTPTFFARVREGEATAVSLALHACVTAMEEAVRAVDPQFESPLMKAVSSWGAYAHKRREGSGQGSQLASRLEHWYEAMRLLVVSWEEAETPPSPTCG